MNPSTKADIQVVLRVVAFIGGLYALRRLLCKR